ncbi:membrane protein insertase YidC [Micavibrio aeruginosavorus]|uniref:Membrane protein insertase YidC n=1 Tax=Micavibrio aeruginosavorus (strain ARL-13) TaxID=856793 RepID=G2KML9_MICAA|nr:membrane protein insertase YidC [Micavibrio aeruginosavorus]AEP10712.1 60Kd inner membrane family protein [Micavibrio aeruginosavorus ARL-13]
MAKNSGPNMMNPNDQMHPDDRRNLVIFLIISLAMYFAFDHFVMKPKVEAMRAQQEAARAAAVNGAPNAIEALVERPRDVVIGETTRLKIDNGQIFGTLPLVGNRIDDISLTDYFKTLGGSDHVVLMSPAGTPHPKYAEAGWIAANDGVKVPGKDTRWSVKGGGTPTLAKDKPVTLTWNNGAGLTFEREYSIDDHFVITLTQRVINKGGATARLYPYNLVAMQGMPEDFTGTWIAHEGPIGHIGGELHEVTYKDLGKKNEMSYSAPTGWIGITEKYWLTSLLPVQGEAMKYSFKSTPATMPNAKPHYQVDMMGTERVVGAGETAEFVSHVYAGAKKVRILDLYEDRLDVPHFDLAVDFGMYYFMTKPFFYFLTWLGHVTGNFGVAILIFTLLLRAAVFPLANTSFRSFARLKQLAPQMTALREEYGHDKEKLQKELVALYGREKVNPAAGCLPILIQIPIFFALYKVLSVTIEMRHAPFFGWIQDLSMRDPTSLFNLFGLLPYNVPDFLMIGVWPCLMLFFMILQKSMNPPPQDPIQAKMLAFMPYFMTYIMAGFASGLVIYWTFSNALSILQQYIINRSMGIEVKFFQRTPEEKKMEKMVAEGPVVHPGAELLEEQVEDALFGHDDNDGPKPVTPRKKKKK